MSGELSTMSAALSGLSGNLSTMSGDLSGCLQTMSGFVGLSSDTYWNRLDKSSNFR